MALLPNYLRRPAAILKMKDAIDRGLNIEGFIRELKVTIGTYRRTNMLADWRSVNNIEARKDLVKYVRKDRLPSMHIMADVEWELSGEYMYKVSAWTQTRPDEPLTSRFVSIISDKLLTLGEVEQQIFSKWGQWENYLTESLKSIQVVEILHRIPSPLEGE